jgi:DNA-binding MarR family transcriptional regulator
LTMTKDYKYDISDRFFEYTEFLAEDIISQRPNITNFPDAQYRMMYHLFYAKTLSMKELGESMYVSKTYITKIVDALTEIGLVERHPDLNDRRIINIKLTKEGIRKFKELQELLKIDIRNRLDEVPQEEQEIVLNSMEGFINLIKKYMPRSQYNKGKVLR